MKTQNLQSQQIEQKKNVVKARNHLNHFMEDIWNQMLFQKVKPTDDIKVQVYAFTDSICKLLIMHEDIKTLIEAALDAMLFCQSNHGQRKSLLKIAKEAVMQHVPELSISVPELLGWELAEHDDEELWNYLHSGLEEQINKVANSFQEFLNEMMMSNVFGIIEWKRKKRVTCRYHYFQALIIENIKTQSSSKQKHEQENWKKRSDRSIGRFTITDVKTTTSDFQQSLVLSRIEHHLIQPKDDIWPAPNVAKPQYIIDMMAKVPTWLSKHIHVVSGDMCKEVKKNHEAYNKKWTEVEVQETIIHQGDLYSPALVFGETVLAGWSDSDLKS